MAAGLLTGLVVRGVASPGGFSGRLTLAALVSAAAAGVSLIAFRATASPARPMQAARAAYQRRPGLTSALAGSIVCLPAIAVHLSVVTDPDSANLLSTFENVQRHGSGYIVHAQPVLVPFIVVAPLFRWLGLGAANWVPILGLIAMGGFAGYLAARLSGSIGAAPVASAGLLATPVIVEAAGRLPLYLPMLFLGHAGTWLVWRAEASSGWRRIRLAAGAALLLALAAESHGLGQLSVLAPIAVVACRRTVRSLRAAAAVYVTFGLIMVPRLLINLSDGGLRGLRSFRYEFLVTKGYIHLVNVGFWHHPVDKSPAQYLLELPQVFLVGVAPYGLGVIAAALVALVLADWRGRKLAVIVALWTVGPLVLKAPPAFPRYLTPILPGLCVAAGIGVARLAGKSARSRGLAGLLAVLVGLGGISSLFFVSREWTRDQAALLAGPLPRLSSLVDDGRAVVGVRANELLKTGAKLETSQTQFLTEGDFVTFLTWPSDAAVVSMMRRNGIGWVMVHPNLSLETAYHQTWIGPVYAKQVRHADAIAASSAFCLAGLEGGFKLYRLGACRPGDTAQPISSPP